MTDSNAVCPLRVQWGWINSVAAVIRLVAGRDLNGMSKGAPSLGGGNAQESTIQLPKSEDPDRKITITVYHGIFGMSIV
jgi:hypothetical protein